MKTTLHPIQLKILGRICSTDGISFSKLHPDPEEIERDQYNFHLKQLIKQGLIYKRSGLYRLTHLGKNTIEEKMPVSMYGEAFERFNVASLMLVIRDAASGMEVLYQKRKRQPMWGVKQIPGGRLKHGEMAEEAASRRLKEETGLLATPQVFKILAMMRVLRHGKNTRIYSDFFYHICFCRNPGGELISDSQYGKNVWIPIREALKFEETSSAGKKTLVNIYKSLIDKKFPRFFYAVEENPVRSY
jgi:ADP-ribose pyrophosphatase YjhB (NUDIX family)